LNTAKVFNFLIKHGIGAPGPMAETQAKTYMKLRQAHPDATEKEILRTIFVQRAKIALATGSKELFYQMVSDSDWVESVVKSNPDLLSMTIYIILCEHPELRSQDPRLAAALLSAGLTQDDIFREVARTVTDVLDKYAPIWRKHSAGTLGTDDGPTTQSELRDTGHPEIGPAPTLLVRFEAHEKSVNSLLWLSDGTRLLSAGIDGRLKFWQTSGSLIGELKASGPVESVAVSPDSSMAACSIANTVDLWDLRTSKKVASYKGHEFGVYTVAFHPAGQHIISSDEETLRFWDIRTGREVHRVTCSGDFFTAVAFSPDYSFAAVSGDACTVRCVDLRTGKERCSLAGHRSTVTAIAVSSDGRYVLTGALDMTSRLWDVQGGREVRPFTDFGHPIGAVAFSPRSAVGLVAGDGRNVCLWNLNTGLLISTLTGQHAGVAAATFSGDGRHVAAGAYDGTICLWAVG
jgi:WD40 repeat protein